MILPIVLSITPELIVETTPLPEGREKFLERWKAVKGDPGKAGAFAEKAAIPVLSELATVSEPRSRRSRICKEVLMCACACDVRDENEPDGMQGPVLA
jgi:hypothetical protein